MYILAIHEKLINITSEFGTLGSFSKFKKTRFNMTHYEALLITNKYEVYAWRFQPKIRS